MIPSLSEAKLVVCAGAGGVGKTTISAALALGLARAGSRVAVVTIDPAKRLATALGMEGLGDAPRRVEGAGPGELWALQLDAKATFDRLIARHAPTAEVRDRILENRIYRHLSGAVAGSQEYMAIERLHELVEEHRFERVVLDTPPAQNALDFLDAPQRITRFIEGRALRMLVRPAGGGIGRLLHVGSSTMLSVLERITGAQLLRDVADFLVAFDGMYGGFAERAQRVAELLASPEAAFLVVTAPAEEPLRQALALAVRLREDGYPLAGAVLNQVRPLPRGGAPRPAALVDALAAAGAQDPERLARLVALTVAEEQTLALRDLDAREALAGALGETPLVQVPAFSHEPVDLAGLEAVTEALWGGARGALAARSVPAAPA